MYSEMQQKKVDIQQKKLTFNQKNENIERKLFFHRVFTDNFDFFLHGFG